MRDYMTIKGADAHEKGVIDKNKKRRAYIRKNT